MVTRSYLLWDKSSFDFDCELTHVNMMSIVTFAANRRFCNTPILSPFPFDDFQADLKYVCLLFPILYLVCHKRCLMYNALFIYEFLMSMCVVVGIPELHQNNSKFIPFVKSYFWNVFIIVANYLSFLLCVFSTGMVQESSRQVEEAWKKSDSRIQELWTIQWPHATVWWWTLFRVFIQ